MSTLVCAPALRTTTYMTAASVSYLQQYSTCFCYRNAFLQNNLRINFLKILNQPYLNLVDAESFFLSRQTDRSMKIRTNKQVK